MRKAQPIHCGDVSGDRKLGDIWEANFCQLLVYGTQVMRHQKDRHGSAVYGEVQPDGRIVWRPSPDVTVWHGRGIESHHEIKHKNAHRGMLFGLEEYRLESLLDFKRNTGQGVYYTIHDHDCSGGRLGTNNDIKHWVTQTIESLSKDCDDRFLCPTYRNGKRVKEMIRFWHRSRFDELEDVLDNIERAVHRHDF
jgi:hypothetical protein